MTQATLVLLTDPVKYLEVANVRVLVQELRHALEEEARRRAATRIAAARQAGEAARREFARVAEQARASSKRCGPASRRLRAEIEERKRSGPRAGGTQVPRCCRSSARRHVRGATRARARPAPSFLATLAERQRAFEDWLAALAQGSRPSCRRHPRTAGAA